MVSAGSCNYNKIFWSKYRLRIVFLTWVKKKIQLFLGWKAFAIFIIILEVICFSIWRFIEADFKKYCFVFNYFIKYSRSTKITPETSDYIRKMYWVRAFHCIFTRDPSYTIWWRHFDHNCMIIIARPCTQYLQTAKIYRTACKPQGFKDPGSKLSYIF